MRYRPIEYESAKICLLVQKGAGGVIYVPWVQMDKEGLQTKLPALMDGAGKWIACLKKNTAGISLAIDNIISLLGNLIGDKTNTVFAQAQIPAITLTNTTHDGTAFNTYRHRIWTALREMFPDRPDIGD